MSKAKSKTEKVQEVSTEKDNYQEYCSKDCCKQYYNHSNKHCHCQSNGSVFGIFVILAGITLFLNNAGIIPWSFWDNLWQFWPVLLIILGIKIILGNTPGTGFIITLLAIFVSISIWLKVLMIISSPLIYQWHLYQLPWFNFLTNLQFQ